MSCSSGKNVEERVTLSDKPFDTAVPNLVGTREWFHGRQFSRDWGWGGGYGFRMIQELHWSLPPAVWPGS